MKFCHSKEVAINQHQASCKFTNNCNLLHLSRRLAISFDLENARGARVKHRVLVFLMLHDAAAMLLCSLSYFLLHLLALRRAVALLMKLLVETAKREQRLRFGGVESIAAWHHTWMLPLTWNMMKPAMRSVQSPDWIFCPSSSRLRMAKFHKINRARAWLRRLIINKHTRSGKWISIIKIILSAAIHCASIMRSKHAIVAVGSWTNYIIAQLEKPLQCIICLFNKSLLNPKTHVASRDHSFQHRFQSVSRHETAMWHVSWKTRISWTIVEAHDDRMA